LNQLPDGPGLEWLDVNFIAKADSHVVGNSVCNLSVKTRNKVIDVLKSRFKSPKLAPCGIFGKHFADFFPDRLSNPVILLWVVQGVGFADFVVVSALGVFDANPLFDVFFLVVFLALKHLVFFLGDDLANFSP
jgi:hypothetical protein